MQQFPAGRGVHPGRQPCGHHLRRRQKEVGGDVVEGAEWSAGVVVAPLTWLLGAGAETAGGRGDVITAYQAPPQTQGTDDGGPITQTDGQGPIKPPETPKAPPMGDGPNLHHRLPRQFKNCFADPMRGLDIEDFVRDMGSFVHGLLHDLGYNEAWQAFIEDFPKATADQVLEYLQELEARFGFPTWP